MKISITKSAHVVKLSFVLLPSGWNTYYFLTFRGFCTMRTIWDAFHTTLFRRDDKRAVYSSPLSLDCFLSPPPLSPTSSVCRSRPRHILIFIPSSCNCSVFSSYVFFLFSLHLNLFFLLSLFAALLSGTLRTYQRAGCDRELVTLSCPRGTSISIEIAQYGRSGGK